MHVATLIRNADIYTPEPLGRRNLLVVADRIVWIGTDLLPDLPFDVNEVDVGGAVAVPGLIDCHTHITGGGGEAGYDSRVPPVPPSQFTTAGVTSVVGLLGTDDTIHNTAELVATVNSLRATGLSAWAFTGGYHIPLATATGSVRRDMALIECIIGVGELAISDHRSSQPTLDELVRIAGDCHVGGLMTGKAGVLHLHVGDGERGLSLIREALDTTEIPARTFHPTHVNRRKALFDEALELAERGCTIDITAFPVEEGEDAWSAADALEKYWASGLPPERVTVSSDGGGCLPEFDDQGNVTGYGVGTSAALLETVRELLGRGHPLSSILPPFTSNPAQLLRLRDHSKIATGCAGNLVILDKDMKVEHVMARGRWVVMGGKPTVKGNFE